MRRENAGRSDKGTIQRDRRVSFWKKKLGLQSREGDEVVEGIIRGERINGSRLEGRSKIELRERRKNKERGIERSEAKHGAEGIHNPRRAEVRLLGNG